MFYSGTEPVGCAQYKQPLFMCLKLEVNIGNWTTTTALRLLKVVDTTTKL